LTLILKSRFIARFYLTIFESGKCCFDKEIIIVNDVRELMKELLSVGNNLTQLTTRAKLMNLEVVDLKPTYMKLVEIYTVLTELMNRVKN